MNPLLDVIPAKARKYVYGIAALLGLVLASWTAADGNWRVTLTSLAGSALTALAHANTSVPPEAPQEPTP